MTDANTIENAPFAPNDVNQAKHVSGNPLHVIISGAGLSGLFLAILLKKVNISYEIYERAKETLPLGSVMSLSCNIFPAFEQLGLYDDLMKVSYPGYCSTFLTSDLKKIGEYTANNDKEMYHKMHWFKKVASFTQDKDGVAVELDDGASVRGDILVGADGAHSAVRQHLYKELTEQGKFPLADKRKANKGYVCLVGTTGPLDPEEFSGVDASQADCKLNVGNKESPYAWSTFTVPGNKICWNVVVQLGINAAEEEKFRNSEWSSTTNEKMVEKLHDLKTTFGKLGRIFDATPKDQISKVFLEDMLYETWHHSRTVLIGDAAHKLLPSTGQGAVNAFQDAVILANCLYELQPVSHEGIQAALKDYRDQRFHHVRTQYLASHVGAKLQYGHAPKRGSGPVQPQKPSKRFAQEQAKNKAVAEAV
ncbi:hypothetical protein EDD21DRAFT_422506 [Dissophora ornata]|nr:hypothetical protein EDD21DRAFT_422506 [Dissophora ornata]